MGQKRRCPGSCGTSVLPSGADNVSLPRHVRLVPVFESGTGLSWSKTFGIVLGIAYQSATSAGRQIVRCVGASKSAVRCRSRMLTVSQLSPQAKQRGTRTSGPKNFQSSAKKDFFNTIRQNQTFTGLSPNKAAV
jgi:hypothetical protein